MNRRSMIGQAIAGLVGLVALPFGIKSAQPSDTVPDLFASNFKASGNLDRLKAINRNEDFVPYSIPKYGRIPTRNVMSKHGICIKCFGRIYEEEPCKECERRKNEIPIKSITMTSKIDLEPIFQCGQMAEAFPLDFEKPTEITLDVIYTNGDTAKFTTDKKHTSSLNDEIHTIGQIDRKFGPALNLNIREFNLISKSTGVQEFPLDLIGSEQLDFEPYELPPWSNGGVVGDFYFSALEAKALKKIAVEYPIKLEDVRAIHRITKDSEITKEVCACSAKGWSMPYLKAKAEDLVAGRKPYF